MELPATCQHTLGWLPGLAGTCLAPTERATVELSNSPKSSGLADIPRGYYGVTVAAAAATPVRLFAPSVIPSPQKAGGYLRWLTPRQELVDFLSGRKGEVDWYPVSVRVDIPSAPIKKK